MADSTHRFRPHKCLPSASSSILPSLSDRQLLHSLLYLSQEISSIDSPPSPILTKSTASIIRMVKLISLILESLVKNDTKCFSPSAILCFEELYIVLEKINALNEDLASWSKTWILMKIEFVWSNLHEITSALSTILDIFPADEMDLDGDVREVLNLVRKQCVNTGFLTNSADVALRTEARKMLDDIERGVVPDHLKLGQVFDRLQLKDSASCGDEIESLQDEIQNQDDERSKYEIVSLIGLVRYAKCVLYSAAAPGHATELRRRKSAAEVNIPSDFRCPISLDLIQDPVVVLTGQTYDRPSIVFWIESGHNTCPKTGQTLSNTAMIPNHALRNLIAMWCRQQGIPFGRVKPMDGPQGIIRNKTALEATKMTVSFLLSELRGVKSTEMANRYVYELRVLAKVNSDSRACIAEAGALPILVKFLASEDSNLQINAVTTILNLSILEMNRRMIMETEGVVDGVIEVLRSGATWEAKGNAATTIFSLIEQHACKKLLGRKTRVIKGLIDLAREGPTSTKRDALVAILSLVKDREMVVKLVEGGVVGMSNELIDELPEEVVIILELVVKKGGLLAVSAAYPMIRKLTNVLRTGTDRAREYTTATLVNICRKGGSEAVAELATISGIERVIWEMMGMGTERGRRKAASLLRILRRWAAGLDANAMVGFSSVNNITTTPIVLPSVTNL